MTAVTINELSKRCYLVKIYRLGLIGKIRCEAKTPWKFMYTGTTWTKLTYDENTAVLAAVEEKRTVLNIARVLTQ